MEQPPCSGAVPGSSRLFRVVPELFRVVPELFRTVPGCSGLFRTVPVFRIAVPGFSTCQANPGTLFTRMKEWVQNNKLPFTGWIVTILGGVAAVTAAIYQMVKGGSHSLKDMANSSYTVAKKTAKAVAGVGSTVSSGIKYLGATLFTVLTLLANIMQYISYYIWIVIIAIAYFVYEKIIK